MKMRSGFVSNSSSSSFIIQFKKYPNSIEELEEQLNFTDEYFNNVNNIINDYSDIYTTYKKYKKLKNKNEYIKSKTLEFLYDYIKTIKLQDTQNFSTDFNNIDDSLNLFYKLFEYKLYTACEYDYSSYSICLNEKKYIEYKNDLKNFFKNKPFLFCGEFSDDNVCAESWIENLYNASILFSKLKYERISNH